MSFFSKPEVLAFPVSLKTDEEGFHFLANLLIHTARKQKFILDFKNVTWLEANLCAILGAIIITNKKEGASFTFQNFNNQFIENTLRNNGFLKYIKAQAPEPSKKHSGIPLEKFDLKDEDDLEEYIYEYVLLAKAVPDMSEGAKRKIFRSIFELYQNSVMHSGAENVFVCGQFYHNKKRMALTMVEVGRTFKDNVTEHAYGFGNFSGRQSIEWAVESGNTTKPKGETGGLGLDLIREFLRMNFGKIQIRSADGYWEEKKGVTFAVDCKSYFQGSIVNIEFNLRDKKEYTTPEEIDIKSIF
ncbi:hypothetical protein BXY85_3700 [Roseivirga pacifica]|uniref:Uncharacterized protein n=1 Tax=Roseivirga pacifica TaxID=1267423 RepID=A0A1I0QB15_9BACT|nr:hypothetical protein [Roseivirga pacifica]RKQ43081.1 hypothetical protein BXY85_3700 [Roseivirga pacifica]SEW24231.1 hypothetical protein SAMN05216290_2175 [Roseivirga pacifica]